MIRILVADDQNLIRQALQVYLETESDLTVVGHAEDGFTALEKIEELSPDIALVDLDMPGMDGLTTTKIASQRFSKTKVLVFSSHDREEYINDAIQAGARGYLLKSTPAEELASAIRYVNKGYFHLGPGLFEKLIVKFALTQPISDSLVSWEDNLKSFLNDLEKKINDNTSTVRQDFSTEISKQNFTNAQELRKVLEIFQYELLDRLTEKLSSSIQHKNYLSEQEQQHQNLLTENIFRTWESQKKLEIQLKVLNRNFLIVTTILLIVTIVFTVSFGFSSR
jgi:DNA-binding NarL/FixJ family response regulator